MIKVYLEKIEVKIMVFEIGERSEYREFGLVQGDTLPAVRMQFLDDINDPIDLTGYTVDFFFKKAGERTLINAGHTECVIIDSDAGIAEYQWAEGDTARAGIHWGSFQITTDEGKKQSIKDAIRFNIRSEIDLGDGVSGHSYVTI